MSKIMVVEDDASLREIYSIRITAEGYDVVSAGDGEEALAVAVREKPDLILSDVMMPKISGFDMLDILRSTPEVAGIKVIMMTALSADDQRQRGERLGADRYLVKSQVGIEDVINTIHEVLGDKAVSTPATTPEPAATPGQTPTPAPTTMPEPTPTPEPAVSPTPSAPTPAPDPTAFNIPTPPPAPVAEPNPSVAAPEAAIQTMPIPEAPAQPAPAAPTPSPFADLGPTTAPTEPQTPPEPQVDNAQPFNPAQ